MDTRFMAEEIMRVAFFGLGIMGRPMAANLVKAGHEVSTWNRSSGKELAGARAAGSPREAAEGADVVWMCVSDTAAVERVLFAEDGAAGALQPGSIVVDSSTISPAATREFARRVEEHGADYVDAPVTGSKVGAEAGQLIFMAGGKEETLEKLKPLWSVMGKTLFRMGDVSMGQATKLGMNLMIALIFEGFAEALALTGKLGVKPDALIPLIQASMVRSCVVDYKAQFVLRRDFTPNFPLRLMHKDIRLMLEAAKEQRVKLPGLETVAEIYDIADEEGQGDLDYAATITLLEKWAGVEVKGTAA
jgi:2-hydroxy-3-oxopropionate reductase